MISECGFSYTSASGGDQTAYAADQLNKLYSYANMIFPQTKAVFYFDKDMSGSAYHYALSGSSTLASTYENAIQANGSYLKEGQTSAPSWTALSNVSQGQKQLLCIARVMLRKPPILILDEATSSIDTRTEVLVQDAFEELMKGRTSFIVAHRLSTIKNADQILVMKAGNIIERGTHEELLARGGFYANLYASQFARA